MKSANDVWVLLETIENVNYNKIRSLYGIFRTKKQAVEKKKDILKHSIIDRYRGNFRISKESYVCFTGTFLEVDHSETDTTKDYVWAVLEPIKDFDNTGSDYLYCVCKSRKEARKMQKWLKSSSSIPLVVQKVYFME